jgi:PQQ-dependent dehydrogenase (methanol/ethanol family)
MTRPLFRFIAAALVAALAAATGVIAQRPPFVPVSQEMLLKPSPDDWLMYSRTYDAQRFSPLKQINRENVRQLKEVFKKELGNGPHESIPIVYRGVMYLLLPGAAVQAVDASTGALIWEHRRPTGASRAKTIAIYEDMVYYTSPDGYIVALDARTGEVRWETKSTGGMVAGVIVVEGKVISGRSCSPSRDNCYVAAHDARTGVESWRFYTAAGSDEPGGDTWAGAPDATRSASTWGLPGGYDPVKRLVYWGVANPTPNTRANRHGGRYDAVGFTAPIDLYSNSTIALNPDTGKLAWYYQHLPGDDWDEDYPHERTLTRTAVRPNPKFVKWINPDVKPGEVRDIAAMVGEGGGVWALDRVTGQFLWASPFPFDTPDFLIANIEGKTGRVHLNPDKVFTGPQDRRVICYWNTRSYWPTAFHPGLNALFVPYVENCLDMTTAGPNRMPPERRAGIPRPGSDPNTWAGLMKINLSTGEMTPIYRGRAPSNGAVLTTAGDVVFWGDLDRKFRAFDAASGKVLWEQTLAGPVQNSTLTYAVNGRQYVAVITGSGGLTAALGRQAGIAPGGATTLHVFALGQ